MKFAVTVFAILVCTSLNAQYSSYKTKFTCPIAKKELIAKAQHNIKTVFDSMMKDAKLLNYDSWQEDRSDSVDLYFIVSAEDDAKFNLIKSEWKKRASAEFPSFFPSFFDVCPDLEEGRLDSLRLIFPVIKGDRGAQVVMVDGIDEKPDPKLNYNLIFDLTAFTEVRDKKFEIDSSMVNWGLSDIGRIINLHLASGIPKSKLNFVVAVHGMSLTSFLNNQEYQKKFKIDNPNLPLIDELANAGVKFLLCGQSITWMHLDKSKLSNKARVTLTAQTTLTSYQLKGYALKPLSNW